MEHGSQSYFAERVRNGRRLSITAAAVGLLAFAALGLGRAPAVRRVLNDPKRFGYEGPEQYVQRITLQPQVGESKSLRAIGPVTQHSARRGGTPMQSASRSQAARPETRERIHGPGESAEDLLARTYTRKLDVPLVQSEDLVLRNLVQPIYPEHVRDASPRKVRVSVIALVDTSGRVVEVQVLPSEPRASRAFGEAASEAVWRTTFRPYIVDGKVSEVYGQFTFNFTRD